ncbi:hypothetical protein AVEN_159373-1 [Araneus ventricosus]|uniref:Helitron helicase-like domain-containing protein n=1 Tax=Araneus ventricosus TaxID=182803 RepID=A0A4Y2A2Y2_ARAVE|nr:hypothetical protein AVEN_159373-1 [Araneus ventricosus]
MRKKQSREKQAEEQKSHIRELDRIYRADGRANETAEETERRRTEDRFRTIARRNNTSAEETQQRHFDDRLRASARRNSMTAEETEERRSEDRLRKIARRNNITAEETEQRRSEDRLRTIAKGNNMTAEETEERCSDDRLRAIARRNNESFEVESKRQASDRLRTLNLRVTESNEQRERRIYCNSLGNQNRIGAETFDARRNGIQLERIVIGSMPSKCTFCGTLKFEADASKLCCSNGKVSLPGLLQLPEPLNSLTEGNHPKSKEFPSMIRKCNSSFQMTPFGTSLPMLDSTVFMPTFRIQGKIYHKPGSLISLPNEEANFLQIYFHGNEEAEAKLRCKLITGITKSLIESLQKMLHESNH